MKYLITGNGGREHAIAWKLRKSPEVHEIYCMPGNAGTSAVPNCVNIPKMDFDELLVWATHNKIERVFVGSEDLLVAGIADLFLAEGIDVIGPPRQPAMLEGSKAFAKEFMNRHNIRTAAHREFSDIALARAYLEEIDAPIVIKADGLASGKGVVICQDKKSAERALNNIMSEKVFGRAGEKVVIEQYLDGFECSVISMYDGKKIRPLLPAKDHKKIGDNETGKNTGGMGVIAPNPYFTEEHYQDFVKHILQPTEEGLAKENLGFSGIIYFGLMIVEHKCYLLEYNLRFGDPETQALLPLMKSDLHELFNASIKKELANFTIEWKDEKSCCVVLASRGYPDSPELGNTIELTPTIQSEIFYAGADSHNGTLITSGGRVLSVVALGNSYDEAHAQAYKDISHIYFDGKYCRSDIGKV